MTQRAAVVRVMTWNIHGALGRNPRFDLMKVVELIKGHDPDIVALQEVDSRRPRAAGVGNPFEVLQVALGSHAVGAKSIVTTDGEYGQALISRWPIRKAEVHDISFQEREPRRAIRCEIGTRAGCLQVIATHLGLSIGERHNQTRMLLDLIGDTSGNAVVLGDFNDWFWIGSVRKSLAAHMPARSRQRTFPALCPIFRFDRIYCRPAAALLRTYTDRTARRLSDHLPIIGEIELAGPSNRDRAGTGQ